MNSRKFLMALLIIVVVGVAGYYAYIALAQMISSHVIPAH